MPFAEGHEDLGTLPISFDTAEGCDLTNLFGLQHALHQFPERQYRRYGGGTGHIHDWTSISEAFAPVEE